MMDCEIDDIQLLPNWKLGRCFPAGLEKPTFSFSYSTNLTCFEVNDYINLQ